MRPWVKWALIGLVAFMVAFKPQQSADIAMTIVDLAGKLANGIGTVVSRVTK